MVDLRHLQGVDGSRHYRWQVNDATHPQAVVLSFPLCIIPRSEDDCLYAIDFVFSRLDNVHDVRFEYQWIVFLCQGFFLPSVVFLSVRSFGSYDAMENMNCFDE